MPDITYHHPDSSEDVLEVAPTQSLMEVAVANGVTGIVGECGGSLSCSTCHVYVEEESSTVFGPMEELEDEMLDGVAAERTAASRLSCQLSPPEGSDRLPRIRVHTPERQY